MSIFLRLCYFFILNITFLCLALGQNKFGNIDQALVEMKYYDKDSSASAVVLFDKGETSFTYHSTKGFQLLFERHRAIKILTKDGYDWADHVVNLYIGTDGKEKIQLIKGITYNIENGTLVKSKLEKSSIFENDINSSWYAAKLSMPNVKEGSVIEYTYKIYSDYIFNLQPWQFQTSIPVIYSSYSTLVPSYFNYARYSKGYHPLSEVITKNSSTSFAGWNGPVNAKLDTYIAENIPALNSEAFVSTIENYRLEIDFELTYIQFPNQPAKEYRGNWKTLNDRFMGHENFGKELSKTGFLKEAVAAINQKATSEEEKLQLAINFISNSVKWNEYNGIYVSQNLKKAYDEGNGSAADINLMLTSLLRELGFNSDPVLISTRTHGFVRENLPISDQFNYVICAVTLNNNSVLLDATSPAYPIGVLPDKCLNGKGWRVSENGGGWVDLNSQKPWKRTVFVDFKFEEDGILNGTLTRKYESYAAYPQRSYLKTKGDSLVFNEYKEKNSNWDIILLEYENKDDKVAPLVEKLTIKAKESFDVNGRLIFFNPLFGEQMKENPFKSPDRKFPVDFVYNRTQVFSGSYLVPEGYEVDELPKQISISMPGRKATFLYSVSVVGNEIKITNILDIKQSMFLPEEYVFLREFFSQVVEKQSEEIVLKKI